MKPLHQKIRERFELGPAVHMTHAENLASILQTGGILSYNRVKKTKTSTSLANDDVQAGRALIQIARTGKALHDYVPLYFGLKTPMVACNQHRNDDILFLRFSLDILAPDGVVFTDGNARSGGSSFYLFSDIESLSVLDVKAINTVKYARDSVLRRKKQAEILVPDVLDFMAILDIVCYSAERAAQVAAALKAAQVRCAVRVNKAFYFLPKADATK